MCIFKNVWAIFNRCWAKARPQLFRSSHHFQKINVISKLKYLKIYLRKQIYAEKASPITRYKIFYVII